MVPESVDRPTYRAGHSRDRHDRGMRLPLLPPQVPAFRTRTALFDEIVTDAVAAIEPRWPEQLTAIEFAVDEVPSVPTAADLDAADIVVDGGVPLSHFFSPGIDKRGRATKSRLVVYRRPIMARAVGRTEILELVTQILVEQLAAVLGDDDAPHDDDP